ncbi:IS200/IS605 family transposase [Marinobacter sp. KMM 10035]|uniref:IS200/IS605 family transposase n=1 Tax=Marinobacter sp. KMM 10035 TaxID=3134034 RepID=UPI00397CABD3
MQPKTTLKTRSHAAFRLNYHLILVIKYRHKVITIEMLERMRDIFADVLGKWGCDLVEFNGKDDHVHLLIDTHPALDLSRLVGNLKTVSARHIRKEFAEHLEPYFWKPYFWSRSYCVSTTGGASLKTVKEYVLSQEKPAT